MWSSTKPIGGIRLPRPGFDKYRRSHGFTLVELLVVITIIGILIALLLPAVQAAREAARRMHCANNFKQVALALHNYHAAVGSFPPGMFNASGTNTSYASAPIGFGWSIFILPHLEYQAVYDMFDFKRPSNFKCKSVGGSLLPYYVGNHERNPENTNWVACGMQIPAYLCPSDPMGGEGVWIDSAIDSVSSPQCKMTNICAISDSTNIRYTPGTTQAIWDFPLNDGMFGANGCCRIADVKDGTSNTFMIGEAAGSAKGCYRGRYWVTLNLSDFSDGINGPSTVIGGHVPETINRTICGLSSHHPGGCHFALADGSVGFVSQNTADAVLKALATRDGGNRRRYTVPSTEVLVNGIP